MKVIIAGTRYITDYADVCKAVELSGFNVTEVLSGTALGPDTLGERWSMEFLGKKATQFPADWRKHGRYKAGFIRNEEMGQYSQALVALWDGKSRGTQNMIDIMIRLNKPYFVYRNNVNFIHKFFS